MKGSTNGQTAGSSGSQTFDPVMGMADFVIPGFSKQYGGMSTKGSAPWNSMGRNSSTIPALPEYVNYQQMPQYSSQPVAASDAITKYLASGYASGGAAKASSLEDDIEAALRLARLIGSLTKKM